MIRTFKQLLLATALLSFLSGLACNGRNGPNGPKGNSEGFLGVVAANFDNVRARCNFQNQGANRFQTTCVAVAIDNQGNEIQATTVAKGVLLNWLDPQEVFGAAIQNRVCSVAPEGLSQRCSLTLSQDLPTEVLFQLHGVETTSTREKTEPYTDGVAVATRAGRALRRGQSLGRVA